MENGNGLTDTLKKLFIKAAVGIGLAGALAGGAAVYFSGHNSGDHPAGTQGQQQTAPVPK